MGHKVDIERSCNLKADERPPGLSRLLAMPYGVRISGEEATVDELGLV